MVIRTNSPIPTEDLLLTLQSHEPKLFIKERKIGVTHQLLIHEGGIFGIAVVSRKKKIVVQPEVVGTKGILFAGLLVMTAIGVIYLGVQWSKINKGQCASIASFIKARHDL